MSSATEPTPPPSPSSKPSAPVTPVLRAPAAESSARPGGAAAAPEWHRLHLFQIQPVRDLMIVALLVGVVYLGYVLRPVTVPMLLALALAYLFEPLIKKVTRRGVMSRQGAAVAIIVVSAVVIVVPVTVGVGFAVVQGTQYAAGLARDVRALRLSVDKPDDEALRGAVRPGAWMRIRDYLVELEEELPEEEVPGGEVEGGEAGVEGEIGTGGTDGAEEVGRIDGAGVTDEAGEAASPGEAAAPEEVAATDEAAAPEPEEEEESGWSIGLPAAQVAEARELQASVARRVVAWLELNAAGIGQAVGQRAIGTGASAVGAAFGAIKGVGLIIFTGLLTAFFFFFFSTGWGKTLAFWESIVPERRRGKVIDLVQKMDRVIAGFIRGRLTIVGLLAVYMTLAYWIIGVPAPLVLGPIVGLLFIAPFVHIIGVPIAMLLMWLEPGSGFQGQWWWIVFAPIGVYLIGQALDDWILSPIIQGKSTDMDMPTILFASLAGGILAGVYGLLLAIPAAACIKILVKELVWPRVEAWVQGRAKDLLPIEEGSGGS